MMTIKRQLMVLLTVSMMVAMSTPAAAAWRVKPVKIKQKQWTCWATATAVWGYYAGKYKRAKGQSANRAIKNHARALVKNFKRKGCTGYRGSLKNRQACINKLRARYKATVKQYPYPALLNDAILNPMLKRSHVVAMYVTGSVAHAVVIYGADRFNVCYMDVLDGSHRCRKYRDFTSDQGFILMHK